MSDANGTTHENRIPEQPDRISELFALLSSMTPADLTAIDRDIRAAEGRVEQLKRRKELLLSLMDKTPKTRLGRLVSPGRQGGRPPKKYDRLLLAADWVEKHGLLRREKVKEMFGFKYDSQPQTFLVKTGWFTRVDFGVYDLSPAGREKVKELREQKPVPVPA